MIDDGVFASFIFLVGGLLAAAAYLVLHAATDPGLVSILLAGVVAAIGLAGLVLLIQTVVLLERRSRRP